MHKQALKHEARDCEWRGLNCYIILGFFSSAFNNKIPRMPQEIISPMPTVSIKKGIVSPNSYTYFNTKGTIIVLANIGGRGAIYLCFFSAYVPNAPISVARLPNTTSRSAHPVRTFDKRHPAKSPGMAAGVNTGSIVSASDILT